MTKQEQIAEIANDIAKCCPDKVDDGCFDKKMNCVSFIAMELYNAGYRKVLLDTEYGKMVDCMQYVPWKLVEVYTEIEVDKARKQTAKEILNAVDNESNGQTISITNYLRKKYGVEVEE